jgi:hypothetical protein
VWDREQVQVCVLCLVSQACHRMGLSVRPSSLQTNRKFLIPVKKKHNHANSSVVDG